MDPQMSALLRMMEMMGQETAYGETGGFSVTAFLEAIMPFLPPERQKNIGALLRMIQLQQTMATYAEHAARSQSSDTDWRCELLNTMRPQMPPQTRRAIDLMTKLIEIETILQRGMYYDD